jgi:hypothetical protein
VSARSTGSRATVSYIRDRIASAPHLANSTRRQRAQAQLAACLGRDVVAAGREPARAPGSNVLGAWAAAAERLDAGHAARRRLVTISDGLGSDGLGSDGIGSVGCADLRQAAVGDPRHR